jgi:hypothetical protein
VVQVQVEPIENQARVIVTLLEQPHQDKVTMVVQITLLLTLTPQAEVEVLAQ